MTAALTFATITLITVVLAGLRVPPARRLRGPRGPDRRATASARPTAGHARALPADPPEGVAPAWLHSALIELHLTVDPLAAWVAARWAASVTCVVALIWAGPLHSLVVGALVAATPPAVRRLVARRRSDQRARQMPEALDALASKVRAGSALGPAFVATARFLAEPLGSELRAVAAEVEHGSALGAALDRWSARPEAGPETQLVAAALGMASEAGGEVARAIDRVATTLRERREVQAEVRALATQARSSAAVLVAAPLAFTALVAGVEPAALTFLVTEPVGLACLAGGATLDVAGAMWMSRILRSVA